MTLRPDNLISTGRPDRLSVLAIDPGSIAGFCFQRPDAEADVWHLELPKGPINRPKRWSSLRGALVTALERYHPDVVACELPLSRGQDAKACLFGDIAIIRQACWEFGVTCLDPINVTTVKQHAGVPASSKGDKAMMVRAATLMGFTVENDHEADACVLADYVQGKAVLEAIRKGAA